MRMRINTHANFGAIIAIELCTGSEHQTASGCCTESGAVIMEELFSKTLPVVIKQSDRDEK